MHNPISCIAFISRAKINVVCLPVVYGWLRDVQLFPYTYARTNALAYPKSIANDKSNVT